MSVPLISVIVACRNPGPRLKAALETIWSQRESSVEIVVVDGASTDGSAGWLAANRTRLGALVSEEDDGVYHAMNKGLELATGEWIQFLGSDDRIADRNVFGALASILRTTAADVVVGEAVYEDGRIYNLTDPPLAIRRNFVHHQAAFYRRALFRSHGAFETRLRVMADYEFNLRLLARGARFLSNPIRVAECGTRGLSDRGAWLGYREEIAVRHRYFPLLSCLAWDLASMLRWIRKRFVVSHHG